MAKKRKSGNGTVRKRKDGRWEGRVVIGYDENGLPKTKNVLGKTKSACLEKLKALTQSLGGNSDSKVKSEMLFKDWLAFWYETRVKETLRPNTQSNYQTLIHLHITPHLGNTPLNKISQSQLQKFYVQQKESGRTWRIEQYGTGLSDRTVRSIHMICRTALEVAVQMELLRNNPATDCKLPPKKSKEMQILNKDEVQRFLMQAKYEGYYTLFLLELATGLRRGELLALQWDDIDFSTGALRIDKQVHRINGELTISSPKTKSSIRTITLPKGILQLLWSHRKDNHSKWLFPSPVKEDLPLDPASCRKKMQRILERSGCKHMRFHDWRHLFSTSALASGMDIKTLSATLGHVSTSTTLDIYTHITNDMQQNAARKIDDGMSSLPNNSKANSHPNQTNELPDSSHLTGVSPTVDNNNSDTETPPPAPEVANAGKFEPYQGTRRRAGTGCMSHIKENLWEGRYSPKYPDGKKHAKNVYAHTKEECEVKLAQLIVEMKAEIAELIKQAKEKAIGVPV